MRTIISTVGTSLLTNTAKALGISAPNEKQLFQYLNSNTPEQAGAETNSITKLRQEGDRLIFLHSQTEEGRLCADLLRRHFSAMKVSCAIEAVPDLSYQESRFKMRGLRSLVNTIIRLIREERKKGATVILNATGGFKAEIAYATLIGLLFDVPVYYIHEAFREIIEMPPTPIAWDYTLMAENEEFFSWLDEEPRKTVEVDARLKSLPKDIRFLVTEEAGDTFLSPAGEIFFKAFTELVAAAAHCPVYLSPAARQTYRHAEPSLKAHFDREINKLRAFALRRPGSDQVRNCDCLVYPKGHRDERMFYFEKDEGIYVCELARHSDKSYERLIDRGIWKKDFKKPVDPAA